MKKALLILIYLLAPTICSATHLLGGEITYKCLGNNRYDIEVIVFVDCGPTNTNNQGFDDEIEIAIYNKNNLSSIRRISNPEITQVNTQNEDECINLPSDLCIKKGVYRTTIFLPPITGGYQIAFQRCCRNPSIGNIDRPEDIGSTLTTSIPGPELINECNNSASFNSSPPLAICIGKEAQIDLSASDQDGDSLVYQFSTPLLGANNTNPNEISPPPFSPVVWESEYSEEYPINSQPALQINSKTGLITGIPTSMGLYSIAIKVSEYRNGVYINEILRDFTLLVVDCDIIKASFPTPDWYCKGLTVDFENNSSNANTFHWDFGDNETTSSEFEPSHTYPDTGKYTARLIANPESNCSDTSTVTFPLYTELLPYFENPEPQDFKDNNFNFLGEGVIPQAAVFNWDFGAKAIPETSNQINPKGVRFTGAGSFPVLFNITYGNCDETHEGGVKIFDTYSIWTPNSFTPNGDDKNDYFIPVSDVIKNYDIEIYNRWGELIFQSSDENLGWDGKDKKGNSSEVGTYHYRIQFKDPKEKVTSLSGIIHLIR